MMSKKMPCGLRGLRTRSVMSLKSRHHWSSLASGQGTMWRGQRQQMFNLMSLVAGSASRLGSRVNCVCSKLTSGYPSIFDRWISLARLLVVVHFEFFELLMFCFSKAVFLFFEFVDFQLVSFKISQVYYISSIFGRQLGSSYTCFSKGQFQLPLQNLAGSQLQGCHQGS